MGRTFRLRKQRQELALKQQQSKDDNVLPDLIKHLVLLGWRNGNQLSARNFDLTGRGLCSKSHDIEEGSDIIRLPADILISIKTLEEDEDFVMLFNKNKFDKDNAVTFQGLMAFYIMHHKILDQMSLHKEYIKSLPCNFSTPYFCPTPELKCLPDAVLEHTVQQNRKIKENYQRLKAIFNADHEFETKYPLQLFKWSYFVVNSRSVYVLGKQLKPQNSFFTAILSDDCNLALAPFLDLFNHSDLVKTQADLILNKSTKQLEFVLSLNKCPQGKVKRKQQLFISYGALTNFKLFVEYGFIIPYNWHDYFEFSLSDIELFVQQEKSFKGKIFHKNKFKFIRDHNLYDQMFVHRQDGISHNLHVVLHLLFREQSYFPNILNQVAFGSAENLESVEEEIDLLLKFKLCEYKQFLQNLNLIENLSNSGIMARLYLTECINYLEHCLADFNKEKCLQ